MPLSLHFILLGILFRLECSYNHVKLGLLVRYFGECNALHIMNFGQNSVGVGVAELEITSIMNFYKIDVLVLYRTA